MLIGKKVILRALKRDDVPLYNKWRNDLKLISLTMGVRFPKTIAMDEDWFDAVLKDKSNRNVYFSIDSKENGELIGMISLNNIDYVSGIANWGFVIGETENQGKGISREVVDLFCDYAFNTLNLRKLWGFMIECNEGAARMHMRIGSVNEGLLRNHVFYNGEYHDVRVVSLFKDTYLLEKRSHDASDS